MEQALKLLEENPCVVLSTVDAQGRPHGRVVQYLFAVEGRLCFCTNRTKNMSRQLKEVPYAAVTGHTPDFSAVARVNGRVEFVDSMELKARALEENPGIKALYGGPEHPDFEIFQLTDLSLE